MPIGDRPMPNAGSHAATGPAVPLHELDSRHHLANTPD
jgi:hypothetical protein